MVRGMLAIFILPCSSYYGIIRIYISAGWISAIIIMLITMMAAAMVEETFRKGPNMPKLESFILPKILVIRFSSIGDIVSRITGIPLPEKQLADTELHFVTKRSFAAVTSANPYIDHFLL